MRLNDPGKLLVMVLAISAATALLGLGKLSEAAWSLIVGTCVGYATGNGRLASRGSPPQPMIGPAGRRDGDDQADDEQSEAA